MAQIGCYRGVRWVRRPLLDVLHGNTSKRLAYVTTFPVELSDSIFLTQREMREWIDKRVPPLAK